MREIERGMLISEEILRHLVTVIEDRGPALEEIEARQVQANEGAGGEADGEPTTSDEPTSIRSEATPAFPPRRIEREPSEAATAGDESREPAAARRRT